MKRKITGRSFGLVATTLFVFSAIITPFSALAFEISENTQAQVEDRFVVGPAKIELSVLPGESVEAVVEIENRTGRTSTYDFSFEDFVGGTSGESGVVLLGVDDGPLSLRNYLSVSEPSVTLKHGDRARVPVIVSVPDGAIPGGKFASLLVSSRVATDAPQPMESVGAKVLGRVAVLFFVTVSGDVVENGELYYFRVAKNKKILSEENALLQIGFENSGTVHLNPYGVITVRNLFGKVVSQTVVDPWFVLPDSIRTRDVSVSIGKYVGWYTATLELNRGYEDAIDIREVSFVLFSQNALILVLILVLVAASVRIRFSK